MFKTKCNKIIIKQRLEKGILSCYHSCLFKLNSDIEIAVVQDGTRMTTITSKKGKLISDMFFIFNNLDRFSQLFEAKFIPIYEIEIYDENGNDIDSNKALKHELLETRLEYFCSQDIFHIRELKLTDFFDYLTKDNFKKWLKLEKELDIIHSCFLYFTSHIKMPLDIKLANIIELFEPIAELVSAKNRFFIEIDTKDKQRSSLRLCIDSIISYYGKTIFKLEYSKNKKLFLDYLVNSRVRIMHIKPFFSKIYLSGEKVLFYIAKLTLLYRLVIINLLDLNIDNSLIEKATNCCDNYNKYIVDFVKSEL